MASHIELQIPSQMKMEDGDDTADQPVPDHLNHEKRCSYNKHLSHFLLYFLFYFMSTIVMWQAIAKVKVSNSTKGMLNLAFTPSYMGMWGFSIPLNWIRGDIAPGQSSKLSKGVAGIYSQSKGEMRTIIRRIFTSWGMLGRAGILISWWLAFNLLIPSLKRLKLLGSPLWKWSLLAFTLSSTYFAPMSFFIIVFSIVGLFKKTIRFDQFKLWGLVPSVSFVFYFGSILGAWVGYFSTEHGLKQASTPHHVAFEYVTWTCVAFFVGSILCFLKTLFLLKWKADAIYKRFEPRILITGVKYCYLGIVVGGFWNPLVIKELELLKEFTLHFDPNLNRNPNPNSDPVPSLKSYSLLNFIMSQHSDIAFLENIGEKLTSLAQIVKPLQEDGVPDLFKFLENKIPNNDMCQASDLVTILLSGPDFSNPYLLQEGLGVQLERLIVKLASSINKSIIFGKSAASDPQSEKEHGEEDFSSEEYRNNIAKIWHCIVQEQCASTENNNHYTFDDLKRWMVDAHMNCVNMGRTLTDANAIVTRLDMFMLFIIFIVVVLLWLLITGIATTTVLVTVVTPLLALTFIFGDSAKAFFQGIIFCFGTHVFDVGDRCIVDDTELEVKRMSILTTTFSKIGSDEKRTYPNSVLATKAIVNLGWKPDPSDTVELTLDCFTKPINWKMLERKLNHFFKKKKKEFHTKHEVLLKETGDKIIVAINFKHVLNIQEMTHGQCFQKKNKQRSIVLKRLNYFIDPDTPIADDEEGEEMISSEVGPTDDRDQPSKTGEIVEL